MELREQLLSIERRLWTNDAAFCEASLAREAHLVFAETGVITRDVAVVEIYAEARAASLSRPGSRIRTPPRSH
jgi:hypothetical protein